MASHQIESHPAGQAAPTYARIVNVRFSPKSFAPAFEHFRNVSAPLVTGQHGSLGIFGAANHETGNTWAVSFWATHADLLSSNSPPEVVDAMMVYTQWMTSPFSVHTYDVLNGAFQPPQQSIAGEWARITAVTPEPGHEKAAQAALSERLDRLESRCAGSLGTMLLSQQLGNRLLAIELWSSDAALAASDPEAMTQDQRIRIAVALADLPTREEVEIFGRYSGI